MSNFSCIFFCRSLIRHLEISIYLIIQFKKCLLSIIIKTCSADINCLCFIAKDFIGTNDMNQTTSADDFINTTVIESLANNVCPINKTTTEIRIPRVSSGCFSLVQGRIILFKVTGNRSRNASLSTLVPMNRPSSEPLPLVFAVAMTLKPALGRINFPIFLGRLHFLQGCSGTKNFIRGKVDLVKEQDSTSLECFNDWSIVPDGCTINEAETANKIIFISFDCDIYTDEFPTQLSTRLLNRERFAVARETRNERRIERETGLNNFFKIVKITKLDEGIIFLWE